MSKGHGQRRDENHKRREKEKGGEDRKGNSLWSLSLRRMLYDGKASPGWLIGAQT